MDTSTSNTGIGPRQLLSIKYTEILRPFEKLAEGVEAANWNGKQIVIKWNTGKTDISQEVEVYKVIKNGATDPSRHHVLSALGITGKTEKGVTISGLVFPRYASDLTKKLPTLDHNKKILLMQNLARGIRFLHSLKIFHGDIKPSNVLVNDDDFQDVVFADFGVSRILADGTETTVHQPGRSKPFCPPYHYDGCHDSALPKESAARTLNNELDDNVETKWEVSPSDDVYSLGIVFYLIMSEIPPLESKKTYQNFKDECRRHAQAEAPALTRDFENPNLGMLIQDMIELDRENRPNIKLVCNSLNDIANAEPSDDEMHEELGGTILKHEKNSNGSSPASPQDDEAQLLTRQNSVKDRVQMFEPPKNDIFKPKIVPTGPRAAPVLQQLVKVTNIDITTSSKGSFQPSETTVRRSDSARSVSSSSSSQSNVALSATEDSPGTIPQPGLVKQQAQILRAKLEAQAIKPATDCTRPTKPQLLQTKAYQTALIPAVGESTHDAEKLQPEANQDAEFNPILYLIPGMFKKGSVCIIKENFTPTAAMLEQDRIVALKGDLVKVDWIQDELVSVKNIFTRASGFVPRNKIDETRCRDTRLEITPAFFQKHWLDCKCTVMIGQEAGHNDGFTLLRCDFGELVIVKEAVLEHEGWVQAFNTGTCETGHIQLRRLLRLPTND
jgi:serine/threonine protein kinase